MRVWFARAREHLAADLAIHWLAYLGVLLLFTGVFGLVVFSFSEVRTSLRPLAEISIPSSLFIAGWFLGQQRAPFAGRVVAVLGAVLLPVVVIASLTDGASVPPDARGTAFAVSSAVGCMMIATTYGLLGWRRPGSPIRFVAPPTLWLGVAMAALITRTRVPSGSHVASASGWQVAIMGSAILLTLGLVRVVRVPAGLAGAVEATSMPAAALTVLLGLVAATSEGWPLGPTAVTFAGALLVVELVAYHLDPRVTSVLEILLVGASVASLAPGVSLGWQGAVAGLAYLGLVEWTGLRRPTPLGIGALAGAATVGVAVASAEPWSMVVAFGAATMWAHLHRMHVPAWLSRRALTPAAAILPIGVVVGLFRAVEPQIALLAVAATVAAVAMVLRVTGKTEDAFWRWNITLAAPVVAMGTVGLWPGHRQTTVVVSAALATLALALTPARPVLRGWSTAASALWTLWTALTIAGSGRQTTTVVFAVIGLAFVVPTVWRREALTGHLALAGHVVTTLALVPAGGGAPGLVVGACFLAAFAFTAAVEARGGSPATAVVRKGLGLEEGGKGAVAVDSAPLALGLLYGPLYLLEVLHVTGAMSIDNVWSVAVASGAALLYAAGGRLVVIRPTGLLADLAFLVALVGAAAAILASTDAGPGAVGFGSLTTVVWIIGRQRRPLMIWAGWASSVAFVGELARLGRVPVERVNVVLAAWGALLLIGGLLVDDMRSGRRTPGRWVRSPEARVPVIIGGVTVAGAWWSSFGESRVTIGWWSVAVAALALVVGVQLRVGSLSGVTAALAIVAAALLTPMEPLEQPWTMVIAAAALVGVAGVLQLWEQAQRDRAWWWRWDLPWFGVAHVAAGFAIGAAIPAEQRGLVWVSLGGLSALVSARLRRVEWLWAAAVLLLASIGDLGAGSRVVVLASISVVATVMAVRMADPVRTGLRFLGALSAAAAFAQFAVWEDWTLHACVVGVSLAAALVFVTASVLVRAGVAFEWVGSWVAITGLGIPWALTVILAEPDQYRSGPSYAASVALVGAALGAALLAGPLARSWLRESSALLTSGALALAAFGSESGSSRFATGGAVTAITATLVAIGLDRVRQGRTWVPAAGLLGAVAGAVTLAAAAITGEAALALALLTAGLQVAAFGQILRRVALTMCAPGFLVAAWVLFAHQSLGGNPQWYTVPVGVAMLVVAAIGRGDRRSRNLPPVVRELLIVEYAGMVFVVGAALLQTITTSLAYVLVALPLGAALSAWGVLTQVRRRAIFGSAAATGALLLTIVVPLVRSGPRWQGAALWLTLACLGIAAIIVAALLERSIRGVRRVLRRLSDLTQAWE